MTESNPQPALAEALRQRWGRGRPLRRVLLIKPLSVDESAFRPHLAAQRRYYNYAPYGLGLLCAHLRERGYEVELLDLNLAVLRWAQDAGGTLDAAAVRDCWQACLTRCLDRVVPDVVGVTCTFTMTHGMMLAVANHVKRVRPEALVVAGGVHVTAAAETVLREGAGVDVVCLYEADRSFADLLEVINGRASDAALAQCGLRIQDEPVILDTVAQPDQRTIDVCPDYRDLPIGSYAELGEVGTFRSWWRPETRPTVMWSNRGCRGRCAFCTVWRLHAKRVRCRSVDAVLDEMAALRARYGINHITWLDDDLFYDADRALKLFAEMSGRGLNLTWDATNGVITRAVARRPELIEAAAASGCLGMYFGIESGSPEVLRAMRKPSDVDDHRVVGRLMRDYPRIFTRGFLMMGFPGETLGQINQTVALAREMDLDWYTVSLLTPLPSTDVYATLVQAGAIDGVTQTRETSLSNLMKYVGYGYAVRHGESRRDIESGAGGPDLGRALAGDPAVVPTREELNDLWILIDYRVNYEKILTLTEPAKLVKMERFLADVADRMTQDHPLAHLFLAVVLEKLGRPGAAAPRRAEARRSLAASPYWQAFFAALDLERLLDQPAEALSRAASVAGGPRPPAPCDVTVT